jgi:Ca2+-binding RTX toxin-like protein
MPIKFTLDQWADGKAPDAKVPPGAKSQTDMWQNGNLGSQQAHYNEGDFVPYRTTMTSLTAGTTYYVTIQWDTTQQGKHALDYIGTWDYSFPLSRNETYPSATIGVAGVDGTSSDSFAIPTDPNVAAGPDGFPSTGDDITQVSGNFTLYGGVSNIHYVLAGTDGLFGTADDITDPANPYTLSGSYSGNSSTSITLEFTYTGDSVIGDNVVIAWGGHIATRLNWGDGFSAVAISGSPYHMRLTGAAQFDGTTASVLSTGNQDRSLSSDAVTFPAAITIVKETTPDASSQSFDFVLERSNSVDVIAGKLDLNGDGQITAADDGTFTDQDGELFNVVDGVFTDADAGGDGKINGLTITSSSNIANLAGLGDISFSLTDGGSTTFGGITDFGSFTVREIVPSQWQLDSINRVENDPVNTGDVNDTVNTPSGNQTAITLTEGDSWTLTFNDSFIQVRDLSIDKSVTSVKNPDNSDGGSLVDQAGDVINYAIAVTNTGNVALTGLSVTDQVESYSSTAATPVLDGSGYNTGDTDTDNVFDPGETWNYTATYTVTATDISNKGGGDGDIDNVATASADGVSPDKTDTASVLIFNPVTITGNPQFNFPNDVSKIQPKLQGGSFTLNQGAYIYWDLFTSNSDLAQIKLDSAASSYAGLHVSIVKIWDEGTAAGTGPDATYRIYVANETDSPISLANNTNIVSYSIVDQFGNPALSTNKGLLDLVNADPIIGNFNNFSNIENALTKDATDNFLTNPTQAALTAADPSANRVWASVDESGTGINEAAVTLDTLAANDSLYGRSNGTVSNNNAGDNLTGGPGNDMIDGRIGNDTINGGDGNDYLFGGLGNDTIDGGAGNDIIIGSYGINTLTGGTGDDVFVLRVGYEIANITDFDPAHDSLWIWVDTLDGVATTAFPSADVDYDSSTGDVSVALNGTDYTVIAHLLNTPATVDTTPLNSSTGDIFLT